MNISSLTLIPLFFFFLFDNYLGGARVLDFAGLFILIALTILRICQQKGRLHISPEAILITFFVFLFFSISFLFRQDDLKAHIGVGLGLLVFLCYYSLDSIDSKYHKGIDWLLRISIASIFFQIIYIKIFGHFPKLVFFNVDEVRAMFAGDENLLRPTGFFMEPNNYCISTTLLVLIRRWMQRKPFDFISYLAIVTLFISLSLWGIFIGWGLVFYDLISRRKKKSALLFVMLTIAPCVCLYNFLDENVLFKRAILNRTLHVMQSFFSDERKSISVKPDSTLVPTEKEYMQQYKDASLEGRYGGLSTKLFNVSEWDLGSIFGHGISTTAFQNYAGANGLSFLLYSVGIFGILILLFIAWVFKVKRGVLVAVFISLLSYPLVTYFFWWAWLGMLLRASSVQSRPSLEAG